MFLKKMHDRNLLHISTMHNLIYKSSINPQVRLIYNPFREC